MRRLGLAFIALLITMVSLTIIGAAISQWMSAGLSLVSILGAAMSLVGFFLAGLMVRSALRRPEFTVSRADLLASPGARGILRVAQARAGQITVSEAALECRLSTEAARDILDAFYVEGVCEQKMTSAGQEVYLFADFADSPQADGEDLLNDEDEVAAEFDALLDEAQLDAAQFDDELLNEDLLSVDEAARQVAQRKQP
ncbi:hypothetical protein DFR33_101224 [Bradymonas sediminis]|uniref:Uncharacterized protein n=2 Tax=Bradymonas sediminis TaxID=1548548 RepID=A0A2Z4FH31_9DELT|nr:hypothetical protein DN745_02140 [Bradymonas sediminis]TDP77324.1 hypothetical protein DFR33_101224 [Bradymonas sediminis]